MATINPLAATYSEKLRVRVCGICIQDDKLLLVKHGHTVGNNSFWSPPGGGLEYGETMQQGLAREFKEETGLSVRVNRFLFVNEFLRSPLHAVELFFEVSVVSGNLETGLDPEAKAEEQLLEQVEWLSIKDLNAIPLQDKHRTLQLLYSLDDLLGMNHYFLA